MDYIKQHGKKWLIIFFVLISIIILLISFGYGIYNGINYLSSNDKAIIIDTILQIAYGIILAFFTIIMLILEPIIRILLGSIQNAIYILTLYPFIENMTEMSYISFIVIGLVVFTVLLIIFVSLSLFKQSNNEDKKINVINIFKSIILLLLSPLILMLVMALMQLLGYYVFGINDFYQIQIYDLLYSATLGNTSLNWGDTPIADLSELVFKIILFVSTGLLMIWFLGWFVISLGTRIFELLTMGFVGLFISTSSYTFDNGDRFRLWMSIMIQKIVIPIISLIGYLLWLVLAPILMNSIKEIPSNVFVIGFEDETKAMMDVAVLIGGGYIIKSLLTEWSFIIAGENYRGAFANQMNMVMGDLSSPIGRVTKSFTRAGNNLVSGTINASPKAFDKTSIISAQNKKSLSKSIKQYESFNDVKKANEYDVSLERKEQKYNE